MTAESNSDLRAFASKWIQVHVWQRWSPVEVLREILGEETHLSRIRERTAVEFLWEVLPSHVELDQSLGLPFHWSGCTGVVLRISFPQTWTMLSKSWIMFHEFLEPFVARGVANSPSFQDFWSRCSRPCCSQHVLTDSVHLSWPWYCPFSCLLLSPFIAFRTLPLSPGKSTKLQVPYVDISLVTSLCSLLDARLPTNNLDARLTWFEQEPWDTIK